jgi:hypothetical protein
MHHSCVTHAATHASLMHHSCATQGTPGHYLLGLRILNTLVSEMNVATPGRTLTQQVRVCAVSLSLCACVRVCLCHPLCVCACVWGGGEGEAAAGDRHEPGVCACVYMCVCDGRAPTYQPT